jgi:hypothetical protein
VEEQEGPISKVCQRSNEGNWLGRLVESRIPQYLHAYDVGALAQMRAILGDTCSYKTHLVPPYPC